MTKKIILSILFITTIFLTGCMNKHTKKEEILKVGFCPTMQEEALRLKRENKNIELVSFVSTNEVLENLKLNQIQAALIGRKAKISEIENDLNENRLKKDSHTLITTTKQIILENDLKKIEISTCLSEKTKELYPELKLNFKDCNYKNGDPWLISWDNFSDEFELLIPINEYGEKIKKFRTAHLYTPS